jgi:hypothetical protein
MLEELRQYFKTMELPNQQMIVSEDITTFKENILPHSTIHAKEAS